MAFFDKLTDVAASITDKAGDVVEITRLKTKISSERKAIETDCALIGKYYYKLRENGEQLPEEIGGYCSSIDKHVELIAETEEKLQNLGKTDPSL